MASQIARADVAPASIAAPVVPGHLWIGLEVEVGRQDVGEKHEPVGRGQRPQGPIDSSTDVMIAGEGCSSAILEPIVYRDGMAVEGFTEPLIA